MNTIQALRTVLQLAQAAYDYDPDNRGHADESGEVDEDQQAIDIVEQLIRDMQASSNNEPS